MPGAPEKEGHKAAAGSVSCSVVCKYKLLASKAKCRLYPTITKIYNKTTTIIVAAQSVSQSLSCY